MANQTVTTTVNYDDASISGLLNGETITINGGSVTVNSDVRWNQQAAVFGSITLSSTLGGSLSIDGRDVWEVPFSASSGNVPAQAAVGSNGVTGGTSGATGELLRVWATGSLDPATAGGAMPATGWIKLRSKTGTFQSGETITLPGGATITASGAGKRSWIHVVGAAGSNINPSRLSTFSATGDWYELGVTSGADNQTLQYPVADGCPAIWIETGVGTGVYEIWLNGGPGTAALWSTTDSRGKFFVCNPATGIITLAARTPTSSANNGLRPAAGLRIRIPNVLMSSSTSANWNLNHGATADPTTLYTFSTAATGAINLSRVSSNWYVNASNCYGVTIQNSGIACGLTITNTRTAAILNNVGVGIYSSTAQIYGITVTGQFAGATFTDVFATRFTFVPNSVCVSFVNGQDITLTRLRVVANCPFPFTMSGAANVTITDFAGVRNSLGLIFTGVSNLTMTNARASHQLSGISVGTSFGSSFDFSNSTGIYIEGFGGMFAEDCGATNSVNGIYNFTGCNDVEVRGIGTPAAPVNMFFGGAVPTRSAVILLRCADVVLRRIYVTPSSSGYNAIDFAADSRNVEAINVWSLTNTLNLNSANMVGRGLAVSSGTTVGLGAIGTHWADTFNTTNLNTGVIQLAMNEPTVESASQVSATLNTAAGSGFTGAGSVLMKHASDQIIAEMPYYCLGISGFAATAPSIGATNASNHVFEFQYDLGSGYNGTWLTLTGANLSAITVNPAVGVKLKIRVTVAVAATTNSFSAITISTGTNSTIRQTQYPLPTTQLTASAAGIETGSRIQVYNITTASEVVNEVISGTSWSLLYDEGTTFTDGDIVRVRVRKAGFLPYETLAVSSLAGWAILADQQTDPIYTLSSPTNYSCDFVNLKIRATGARASFTAQEIVDIIRDCEAAVDGIRLSGFAEISGLTELSPGIYTAITVNLLGWQLSWAAGSVTHASVTGGNIVGGISGDPIEDVVGGPQVTVRVSADATVVATGSGVLPADITAIASAVWDTVLASHLGSGTTGEALNNAAAGGGGGVSDWTTTEKNQIRHRLGIDGTAASPSASPSLATPTSVRTELATELGRIDVATSTRLASASYTTPPTVSAIRTEIDTNSTKLDVAVGTRLASASYTTPPTASANATAVRTELTTELARIDATVSSRLASASYTAPDNASITGIKAKTDNLPSDPADESSIQAAIAAIPPAPSASTVASAVRTELNTELARIDVATSTRLASSGYTAPANTDISAIKAKTDNLPVDPASTTNINNSETTLKKKIIQAAMI